MHRSVLPYSVSVSHSHRIAVADPVGVAYADPDGVAVREAHAAATGPRGDRDAVTLTDTDAHTHPQSAQPRVGRGRALRVERDDRFVGVALA